MEKLSAEEREERARLLAEVQQLEEYEKIHPPPPCRDLQPLRLHPVEREACRLLKGCLPVPHPTATFLRRCYSI